MKHFLLLLTLLLCIACCLAGCSKDAESAATDPYAQLKASYAALGLRVQSVEQEGSLLHLTGSGGFAAELQASDGELSLLCKAPEELRGLCYRQDGGGLWVSMEGISRRIDPTVLPQTAKVSAIFGAWTENTAE